MGNEPHLKAHAVVDLGFGDCGKGLMTDHLVRRTGAPVVVRFNGGAQAAHNVVTPDGRHHTFTQFGAGTFAGARTFLSRHVVVHPTALIVEGRLLEKKGVRDAFGSIGVSAGARVITPFHQAMNRLRELSRGDHRHGSCGVGVGETVKHSLEHPHEAVTAGDLLRPSVLAAKLERIRDRLRAEWGAFEQDLPMSEAARREREVFDEDEVAVRWIEAVSELVMRHLIVPDETLGRWLAGAKDVVFEGAQGVLLDEDRGFHPHTTWSRCTFANAFEVIAECLPGATMTKIGVLRSHAVRHGEGPMPTEDPLLAAAVLEHNRPNAWQGRVRYGAFDAVLARYALGVVGGVDTLVVTHMDRVERMGGAGLCTAYDPTGSSQ